MRPHPETADRIGPLCWWAAGRAIARWPALIAVVSAMLVKVGLDILKPWPMKVLVDGALRGQPLEPGLARVMANLPGADTPEGLLTWCVAATIFLFLLGWAVGVAAAWANLSFGQRLVYDLAADLFAHLQALSLRYHSRKSIGDSIRRVTTDCGCVATIVRDALLPVAASVVSLVAMFAIMLSLDAALTLLSLLVVPGMILALRRYATPMLERSYEQQETDGRVYEVVEQSLYAIPVVQAFGAEERTDAQFRQRADASLWAALATTTVQLRFKTWMGLTTALGTAGVVWVGASHALNGQLSVGILLVFLSYLASLYGPLESLVYTSSTIQGAAGSARRVVEVLAATPEVEDRPGAARVGRLAGHIHLEGVTFGYELGRPVLKDLTLDVPAGRTVAVVGATGAGKSTLAAMVPRFFDPWAGRVLLDGIDVRDLRLRDIRRQVAMVLQEPFLFPLSVAENIAYGRPGATRTQVEEAAKAAGAHLFIERLTNGYDTVIGERGATLSGGERQRLAIARAFLKDAPVLILDEPTSALDAETEQLLLGALRQLSDGRTTLIIAHRLSTVRHADQIVVLHHGEVVEFGTHSELLATGGRYARLHALQFGQPTNVIVESSCE